ncbi:MAG: hypothetical protein HYY84_10295 [Deltaproteobacteria bacterium]|nr:hypothetical protein [Deltaproteobacteria bacterium]
MVVHRAGTEFTKASRVPSGPSTVRVVLRGLRGFAVHLATVAVAAANFSACGTEQLSPNEPVEPLTLALIGPSSIVPGTEIEITGAGIPAPEIADLTATFHGTMTDARGAQNGIEVRLPVDFRDHSKVRVAIDAAAITNFGEGRFAGQVTLRADYFKGVTAMATIDYRTTVARALTPTIRGMSPTAVFLGTVVDVTGTGFIHANEGETVARISGQFRPETAPARTITEKLVRPTFVSREKLTYTIDADLFGINPGTFSGSVILENRHAQNGPVLATQAFTIPAVTIGTPMLIDISPGEASRGQRVRFRGRGFIPIDSARDQTTVIRFEGVFRPKEGAPISYTAQSPYDFLPKYVDGSTLELVPWATKNENDELEGLGVNIGRWDGKFTPIIYKNGAAQTGTTFRGIFTIVPTKQVVFMKYLPGFTDSLRKFGLRNVEVEVKKRIVEVARRDYARWNVDFREERPTDFVEYAVVEIGGRDPNGRNMFGLDNTEGKDLGNLRLNDVIGGRNADTEEEGGAAFGGVFVESFLQFSAKSADPIPIATPLFDQIFEPLMADRGGRPAERDEFPVGPRADVIALAVKTLGNIIGSTISHEVGHTLGMATLEGYYHNPMPGPNQLMDSGEERPFEERAELNGQGPAAFETDHVEYLDRILPKQ